MDSNNKYEPNNPWEQLGVDNIQMIYRGYNEQQGGYNYDDEELRDEYINNVAKRQEGKKVIKKNKVIKILMPTKGKIAAMSAILLIAGVGKVHLDASKYIASNVANSIGLVNGVAATSTSSGYRVDYEDEWGNHQGMYLDYFVSTFADEAQKKDISADEFAIFCDRYGLCDANYIDGSSLLGRIGHELVAISQVYSNDIETESKSGRSV